MPRRVPVAWLQLTRDRMRLGVGIAGVAFAVILVFMQLGFRRAIYDSATRYHRSFAYDLVLLSPKTPFIGFPEGFTRRRLYQVLGVDGVESISPVYIQQGFWKNPWNFAARNIVVVGVDPARRSFVRTDIADQIDRVREDDRILFDAKSRPEYGPVGARFGEQTDVSTELNDRRIFVAGLFELGTSFGIDGTVITSDLNFQRLFPDRIPGRIDLGLIQLAPNAEVEQVRQTLEESLEQDVLVLTRADFEGREVAYWASTTPIGYVFGFGAIMGVIVGAVIVYQILFADVSQHLREYATLKAMGYTDGFLAGVVIQESVYLAALGYVPGILVAQALYALASEATRLPVEFSALRAAGVFVLTVGMCAGAGWMALRKVRSMDPAEVFA